MLSNESIDEATRLQVELALGESVRRLASMLLDLGCPCLLEADELHWTHAMSSLTANQESWASEGDRSRVKARAELLTENAVTRKLAFALARLAATVDVLGALPESLRAGTALLHTVALHSRIGRVTRIAWLLERLRGAERGDGWSRVAHEVMHVEMLGLQRRLTRALLESGEPDPLAHLSSEHAACLRQIDATATQIESTQDRSLASLTVLSQQIRRLC